jgi:hypothetical protein
LQSIGEYSNKAAKAHRRITRNAIEDVGVAKSDGLGPGQNYSDRDKKSQGMTDLKAIDDFDLTAFRPPPASNRQDRLLRRSA